MQKTLLLLLTLLLSACWLQAQESQYPASSGQSGTSKAGQTTVEGCLHASGDTFTLTDSSGNTYQLKGDASKLTEHNGHEVQVTGTTSGSMSPSSNSTMNSSSSQQPELTVVKLKHISKTCKASAMGK
jgi:hypothetical protein